MGGVLTLRADRLWACAFPAAGAVLGLIAVVSPLAAVALACAIGFFLLAVADLTVGVAMLAMLASVEVIPGLEAVPVARLVGGVILLSWIAASAVERRPQLWRSWPGLCVLVTAFLGWVALGVAWSANPDAVVASLSRYVPNLLLLLVAYTAVRTRRDAAIVLGAFVVGALASGLLGLSGDPGESGTVGRVAGSGVDPNFLAAFSVSALALAAAAVVNRALPIGWRQLAAGASVLLVLFVVLTASRGGLVALGAAALCAVLVAGRGRRLPAIVLGVLLLGGGAAYVAQGAPPEIRERVTTTGDSSGRTDIWSVGVRMAQANSLGGVGAGNFPLRSRDYLLQPGSIERADLILDDPKVAHNVYLGAWAELGVPGLVLMLALFGVLVLAALRAAWAFDVAEQRSMALLSRSLAVALFALLTAGLFVSMEYEKSLWLLLAMAPALLGLARREAAAAAPRPVTAGPRAARRRAPAAEPPTAPATRRAP